MELLQHRNERQNFMIAEQLRAISKLHTALKLALTLLEELDKSQHYDRGVGEYVEIEAITNIRELLKELKL
jgi:hypothetical protein